MNASEIGDYFKELSSEVRMYHSPGDYGKRVVDDYAVTARSPNGVAASAPVFEEEDRILTTSDMWVAGPGGHEAIAEEFGMLLPEDYLGFVRNYSEYTLVRNVMLWLLPAEEVAEYASVFRRDEWGDESGDDVPHSVFPFALVRLSGGLLFAFRQLSPRKVDVVFFDSGATSEFELMGPQAARFTSDTSFSDWLLRMVQTEGLPFRPGGEIDTEVYTVRRVKDEGEEDARRSRFRG